jgi:DNA-binding GntR family transcriptional regulator
MVRTAEAETLGAGVYEQLRSAVLAGRYAPGQRLRPVELAAAYGVGAGVVREALTRLAEQTLLVAEPNRGYRVRTIDDDQVRELVELRRVTECAALRLSVERGDLGWEERVLAAHRALVDVHDGADVDEMALAHKDFHLALVSGCVNARLVGVCSDLFEESELYRRWAGAAQVGARDRVGASHDRAGEHLALRNAALTRDADGLVALHEAHLRRTADLALAFAAERDDTAPHAS